MSTPEQQRSGSRSTTAESSDDVPQLVFGDDGSASADVVWLWVNNHQWPSWRISVLTAEVPDSLAPIGAERAAPHRWEPSSPRKLLSDKDIQVEHLLAESDPRVALDSFTDAALIAIGPRGRGVMKSLRIGSTADWLIGAHRPLVPVVVVRSARPTRKVMLCLDGSDHARAAMNALLSLPWITSCQVTVLGVDDGRHPVSEAVDEGVKTLRAAGVADVRPEVVEMVRRPTEADVRAIILSTINDVEPDLVAVGARGTDGIRGLLVGSVTAAVVRQASCSVLVAKTSSADST